ncbi:hypothetical protein [uncultured Draconibacterium sp.]|uniref:hypothetical protein n=1 Tax=uncultured Draconibacterium sp. TaxID=1573823 RepID=UPI0025DBF696|nr:hypothetical protein [uncultured Draconibacterium sp.]
MSSYNEKAKQSFLTRLRFFRFYCVVNDLSFTKENFLTFKTENHENLITVYTAQYSQWHRKDRLEDIPKKLSVQDAYEAMEQLIISDETDWYNDYFEQFKDRYPYQIFENQAKADTCEYCKITIDVINQLADKKKIFKKTYQRGYTMEIDRKKPNLEYTTENCVPCCYWCNNAKTDEFNDKEFIPIAIEIRKALENRLEK